MSDLNPRSDPAYRRGVRRRRPVRDRLLWWWLRLEYWLGIR